MDGLLKDPQQEDAALPILRDDLEIVPAAAQTNGAPAWVIFDPVSNRYFEIGRELLDMLMLWRAGSVLGLMRRIKAEFGRNVSKEEISDATHFLISNALVRDIPGNDYKTMAQKNESAKKSFLTTAMHSYLFFRVPLFRPDRILRATWWMVSPLFTRTAVWIFVVLGMAGLYLVSRQWEQFTGTFQFMLSWQGAMLYGASLVVVKSLHELGHAYMSVRYGLRVPTIGIAFMVLMPVLYTDTSGAWTLRSRRQRLMIDGAGIFTELILASLATILWVFLPEGGLRLCVFAVATTSWVTSLAVNLNPLMRFDGYYILSDTLGFQNLQNRSFDMARWRLREILFGLGEPAPEVLTPRMRRLVVLHAWCTWIYRFFLFLGIALLVYTFFIKIIGIILFVIEILWFILLPIWREIKFWWTLKGQIMFSKRFWFSSLVAAGLTGLAITPWSTQITIPSLMTAKQERSLFASLPARIVKLDLVEGEAVEEGEILVRLQSPELERDLVLASERKLLLESRIDRSGSDDQDRASLIVLTNELESVKEEIEGLQRVSQQLVIRAPFAGTVTDVDPELHTGLWVNTNSPLAMLQSPQAPRIKGYVSEQNVFRFAVGTSARFVPDNPELPIVAATVSNVSEVSSQQLDEPYLALPFGGSIAIEEAKKDELRPMEAAYSVGLEPRFEGNSSHPKMAVRGVAILEGEPQSFYDRAKLQVLKVLVRELGA
ncbi:MAG: HlyD family efflux transporter periplasmic adaptor subunit [Rhizobiaceae bacterium]|nr:HlyD family efflux transporter periplasmic adaptor subunit [Rhizobiaceae bacterium]